MDAASALRGMMDAYERRIRSDCTPEQLEQKPWRCAEYVIAEQALSERTFNVAPYPDLDTAKRDFTFGQLWVLGSQYADLLNAAPQADTPASPDEAQRTAGTTPSGTMPEGRRLPADSRSAVVARDGQFDKTAVTAEKVMDRTCPACLGDHADICTAGNGCIALKNKSGAVNAIWSRRAWKHISECGDQQK